MKRKFIIGLLYIVLLSSCSVIRGKNANNGAENDNSSWELMFKIVNSQTTVSFDTLCLNGRISRDQILITAANFRVEKKVIIVKYFSISEAMAIKVYDKLSEDKGIEVLALTKLGDQK